MSAPTTSTDPEVAAYARQVREALADVPAARLEELLEDLEEHLVEVASETPGPLHERLGSPADYAAELRRAAGLPEPAAVAGQGRRGVRERVQERWGDHAAVVAVRDFLPELRPAWWVIRGWAAVAAVEAVFLGQVGVPLPTLGLGPVGWVVTGAAIAWSVRTGLRARAAGAPLTHASGFLNVGLALCAVVAVIGVASQRTSTEYYPAEVSYDSGPTTLTHEDGTPITNIVPYGPDGTPLTGVLLYDQDGRPIDNLSDWTGDGTVVEPQVSVPAQPANAYPQAQVVTGYDEYGNEVDEVFPAPATAAPTP
ncbi:HAAS signaling domain-containing protein [Klenkia brasiliensis]|uniref:Uncharacterized protein n=1 Tax=Klenkia brasiliensis TaxID=333142 RepID=A0A1G7LMU0_9ACTN|nr:hypothetical protein [Klenkia brasiliensis]SDF50330.1 hypothetical protein SAMN05660324_0312 [Klenkia brasiliensis]